MTIQEKGRELCINTRSRLDELSTLLRMKTKKTMSFEDPLAASMLCGYDATRNKQGSQELYEANKAVLMAKARMGLALHELGEAYPYEKDKDRKSLSDIKPATQVLEDPKKYDPLLEDNVLYSELSYIEQLSYLRAEANKVSKEIKAFAEEVAGDIELLMENRNLLVVSAHMSSTLHYLIEVRTMLGWELHTLREEAKHAEA